MSTFADLVDDVLVQIFQYFNLREIPKLMVVCKHWKLVIDSNEAIWKKCIPQLISVHLSESESYKLTLKIMFQTSIKVGAERWFPNPYPLLNLRRELIDFCNQWGFGGKEPTDAGFTLYVRLNPIYDFINGHEDVELVDIIEKLWSRFGDREDDQYDLKSVDDVVRHSNEVDFLRLLETLQSTFEPSYIKGDEDDDDDEKICDRLDLSEFSIHGEYDDKDTSPETFEVVAEDKGNCCEEDVINLRRNYRPPCLGLYQLVMKAMLGPHGEETARRYYLNVGCFNENYEYAKQLIIGENAAFSISQFYDL